jgi:hypothetical protein
MREVHLMYTSIYLNDFLNFFSYVPTKLKK